MRPIFHSLSSSCVLLTVMVVMVVIFLPTYSSLESSFLLTLEQAEEAATSAIEGIATHWSIDEYPNFLRSVGSSKTDWEVLVQKFQLKILQAADVRMMVNKPKFVISFMGSSVTAGHDSPFKQSFPILIGETMAPILDKLGVELITRNVAMGNNPCMPYDVCVQTFAGKDTDMIHWEQTYNCGHGDNTRIFEQFFRQSIAMPNRPFIVITDSETPNWRANDCPPNTTATYSLTAEEKEYLSVYKKKSSGIADIVTDNHLNKRSIYRKFGYLNHIIRTYKSVTAVQLWDHSLYQKYKCRGPYHSEWQSRNAKWHPSLHGHRLRADHHSFFWLAAWRDAITALRREATSSKAALLGQIQQSSLPLQLPKPLVSSNLSDHIQCFTNYEPRTERDMSIHSLVVAGRAPIDLSLDLKSSKRHSENKNNIADSSSIGWRTEIYEALASKKIIPMANKAGYLDYKVVMYGNKASGPLSLYVTTKQPYKNIFLCEAPGIWGKMLNGFASLNDAELKLFISEIGSSQTLDYIKCTTSSACNFHFDINKAVPVAYSHAKVDELCIEVLHNLPVGQFVLTIVPTSNKKVTLATVLVP